MALSTFADARAASPWRRAVDKAVGAGRRRADRRRRAVMAYCRDTHPALRLHLSVQASATSHAAIEFYRQRWHPARRAAARADAAQVGNVINTDVDIGCSTSATCA